MKKLLYGFFCFVFFVLAVSASAQETPQSTEVAEGGQSEVVQESETTVTDTGQGNPEDGTQNPDGESAIDGTTVDQTDGSELVEGDSSDESESVSADEPTVEQVEESDSQESEGTTGDELATDEPVVEEGGQNPDDRTQNPVEGPELVEGSEVEDAELVEGIPIETTDEVAVDGSEVESTEPSADESEIGSEVESASVESTTDVPNILISEVNWAGSELSQADEWIELYNAHGADVDLSGWVLTGSAASGNAIAIADGTMLVAGDVLLISNYDLGSDKTTLTVQPDLVTASISLSNSSLEIMLVMPDGTVIDIAGDQGSPPAGSTEPKASMQRNFSTLEWYNSVSNSNLSTDAQFGTPGVLYSAVDVIETVEEEEAVEEEEVSSSDDEQEVIEEEVIGLDQTTLFLNEFVSDPADDQEEWIEIYNPTDASIELEGWTVRDATERSSVFDQTSIEAGGYALIYSPSGQLNNGGDTIELLNPTGEVVSSVTYGSDEIESTDKGCALALIDGVWVSTTELTPGAVNVFGEAIDDVEEVEEVSSSDDEQEVIEEEVIEFDQTTLFLNEFLSDPTDDQEEWIEIYNPTDSSIELEGWTVRDATERSSVFDQTSIEAGGYALIYSPSGQLNNGGDTIELLNPEGEVVSSVTYGSDEIESTDKGYALALIDGAWVSTTELTPGAVNVIGEEAEEVSSSDDEQEVLEVIEEEVEEDAVDETDDQIETSDESETEELLSYDSGSVLINELVSDPAEGDVEWIELYNPQDEAIDLTGWSVADATDRQTMLEGSIEAGGYFVIEEPSGKLNNGGDTVYLYDPSGNLINQISYGTEEVDEPDKGESLAFDGSNWIVTSEITKSEANTTEYEEDSQNPEDRTQNTAEDTELVEGSTESNTTTSESGADQQDEHQDVSNDQPTSSGDNNDVSAQPETHRVVAIAQTPKTASSSSSSSKTSSSSSSSASANEVTLSGVVTAVPGTFGSQIAFIEGTQLYFYYADWPMLKLGDVVTVSGELSESRGEQRIKLSEMSDVQITGHVDLNPTKTSINGLGSMQDGSLVTIRGEVTDMNDTKIILRDSTGSITVVSSTSENVQWSALSSELEITGVLRTVSGEQRVYPRTSQDVVQIQEEVIEESSNDIPVVVAQSNDVTPWVGGGLLFATLIALAYFFVRRGRLETAPAGA